jgi:hypothetical protein
VLRAQSIERVRETIDLTCVWDLPFFAALDVFLARVVKQTQGYVGRAVADDDLPFSVSLKR